MSLSIPRVRLLTRALLVFLALLAIGFLAALRLGGYHLADLLQLLTEVLEAHRTLGYGIFLLAFFIAALVGIIPLSLVGMLGGALYGTMTGFLLSAAAAMASALAAFLLSRYAFRSAINRWLSRHLVLSRIDEEIAARDWRFVLLLRLSPVIPFSLGSYALGLTTLRLGAFLLGTLGALPALFAFVYTGALSGLAVTTLAGAKAAPRPLEVTVLAAGLVFTVVTIVYFAGIARKAMREDLLRSPRHSGPP